MQSRILAENEKLLKRIELFEAGEEPEEPEEEEPEEEKDIMTLNPAELKDLLDYNHVDVELRERIYEEFNEIKRAERNEMGWNVLHNELKRRLL